ncbi:MAG: hypothetical protein DWQ31_16875 [Planctomycetota bacterium]|nr:MAG: hypothetical protein DWQ31_16875 [Planctomycetota bacterium]REJ92028.1 MAG: hypothetical protein DWQ35_12825 [Planctomycetota bacterium]REK28564.1 MAG: hypothetical protein DWQ42_04415 [Planctomycetota bacterium]REK39179.1 MAG: hypothetical protein DWQ46_18000 [Planctomycetota bacterium]
MSNALVPVDYSQLPSTQIGSDETYDDLAKGGDYLSSMKLYTKGKAIDKGLIPPGRYGIYESAEEITDLGDEIDVIPFARRPFAIDMSDKENIIRVYDEADDEFQRIKAASTVKGSNCQCGVSFLMFERSSGRFVDFFCGTASTLRAAKDIYPFMQLTAEQIAERGLTDVEPHGPLPLTLKVRFIEKEYSWHAPTVHKCSTPFANAPSPEVVAKEIGKFLSAKGDGVERVSEEEQQNQRAR